MDLILIRHTHNLKRKKKFKVSNKLLTRSFVDLFKDEGENVKLIYISPLKKYHLSFYNFWGHFLM